LRRAQDATDKRNPRSGCNREPNASPEYCIRKPKQERSSRTGTALVVANRVNHSKTTPQKRPRACFITGMIVLVSSSQATEPCAAALRSALKETVVVAATTHRAAATMRFQPCSVVVVEQAFLEADGGAIEAMLQYADLAVPVFVNLGIQSAARVVCEVKAAIVRGQRERMNAGRAALTTLRNQLKDDATGILLSSQLALATPSLPMPAQVRLRSVCQLAERLCQRLAG
jgi:hypothetical protein